MTDRTYRVTILAEHVVDVEAVDERQAETIALMSIDSDADAAWVECVEVADDGEGED